MPDFASPWVPFERARALVALGEDGAAAAAYQAAIERDGSHVRAYNDLGLLCAKHGLAADAEMCFRNAVTNDPGNAVARSNLGAMLLARGEAGEAREHFAAALTVAPDFAPAQTGFADASARLDLPAELA